MNYLEFFCRDLSPPPLSLLYSIYNYYCFSNVRFRPLRFYERPTSVPVFTNRKKSERDLPFHTHKKGEKQKQRSAQVLQLR